MRDSLFFDILKIIRHLSRCFIIKTNFFIRAIFILSDICIFHLISFSYKAIV